MKELAEELNGRFAGKAPEEVLAYFLQEYQGHIALASSLGLEDQVLTDMICSTGYLYFYIGYRALVSGNL